MDCFLGLGFMHSTRSWWIFVAQLEQRMLRKRHYGSNLSSIVELERNRCALCMIAGVCVSVYVCVCVCYIYPSQEQMQSEMVCRVLG